MARIKRHPLVWFFLLSYAITWPAWLLEARGVAWMTFPGYFGPAIAALIVVTISQGSAGIEEIFNRLIRWRIPFRWYLVTIFLPVLSVLLVFVYQIRPGRVTNLDLEALLTLGPRLLFVIVTGSIYGTFIAAGEEIGWRGLALPKLLERHCPLVASLIVGIFWSLWHLPLGWLSASNGSLLDALLYGLGIDAAAIIYTWLFLNTGGSLLIASLFHAVYDLTVILAGNLPGDMFSFRVHMLVLMALAAILGLTSGMLKTKIAAVDM